MFILRMGLAYLTCNAGWYYDITNGNCITSQDCSDLERYVYENTKLCAKEFAPKSGARDVPKKDSSGLYKCPQNWYLVLRTSGSGLGEATCARDATGCTNMFVVDTKKVCLMFD